MGYGLVNTVLRVGFGTKVSEVNFGFQVCGSVFKCSLLSVGELCITFLFMAQLYNVSSLCFRYRDGVAVLVPIDGFCFGNEVKVKY